MVTMTVQKEVEATPDLIRELIDGFVAKQQPKDKLSVAPGDYVYLQENTLAALSAVPGMPVRVVATAHDAGMAMVVFYAKSGQCGYAIITMAVQLANPASPGSPAVPVPVAAPAPK